MNHEIQVGMNDPRIRIAYLVPEFPGQTHIFFWRERAALARIGIVTCSVSTRRPLKASMSHKWAAEAEAETFYLSDLSLRDAVKLAGESVRLGPRAWVRA